jgi:hypothetical protein
MQQLSPLVVWYDLNVHKNGLPATSLDCALALTVPLLSQQLLLLLLPPVHSQLCGAPHLSRAFGACACSPWQPDTTQTLKQR